MLRARARRARRDRRRVRDMQRSAARASRARRARSARSSRTPTRARAPAADRGLRAEGPRDRRRAHLAPCTRTSSRTPARALGGRRRAGHARPALRTGALPGRSGARGGAARARQPGPTHPGGRAGGASRARRNGARAALLRRARCAAVPPPWSRRRGLRSGRRPRRLGYLWVKAPASSCCAAWPCAAAPRAIASPCGTPSRVPPPGARCCSSPPARCRSCDRVGSDDPHRHRRPRLPAHAAHPHRPGARRRAGGGPRAATAASSPRAAASCASSSRTRPCRRCRASGRTSERPVAGGSLAQLRRSRPRSMRWPRARADFGAQVANVSWSPSAES